MSSNEDIQRIILRIKRKFQEGIPIEKKIKYLQQLAHMPITLAVLKSTGIGKFANKLRQDEDKTISEKAESLVTKWKKLASEEKIKSPEKNTTTKTIEMVSQNPHDTERPSLSKTTNKRAYKDDRDDEEEDASMRNGNMSFGDALMMPVFDAHQKKKKKKKKENDLLKMPLPSQMDLSLMNDNEASFTPEPTYRPNRSLPELNKAEKKAPKEVSNIQVDITSKKTRSTMYSGKRTNNNGVVQSLYQICMRILLENFDHLYETGGVPFSMLEPLLSKCTPSQLQRFEYYNDYILEDSDVLWKKNCQNEFKGTQIRKQDDETWRETYARLSEEREERLQRLSNKISASQAAKVPERSTKLAYVAGALKGGGHMKKQKNDGFAFIGEKRKELKDRIDKDQRKTAEVAIPFGKIPRRERCSQRPPSSLSATNRHNIQPPNKRSKEEFGSQGPSKLMPSAIKKPGN